MPFPTSSDEPFQRRLVGSIILLAVIVGYAVLRPRPKQPQGPAERNQLNRPPLTFAGGETRNTTAPPEDRYGRYIAIWSKAVDTQMHFNEMSVKSRQLGLTFVAAALGTGVVLLSRGEDFALTLDWGFPLQVHISVILVIAAIMALVAVRILDLSVYHRMLRGAVTFGEDFEEQYMKRIFQLEKGMTQAISHFSRFDDARATDSKEGKMYSGSERKTAEEKIRRFYNNTTLFLCVTAFALFLLTNAPAWIRAASNLK